MIEFKLPAIGEGVVEVEIIRWLKQPGDRVVHNEAIIEVMTDKATVEIPSPHAGVIHEVLAGEGMTAAIGETICTLIETVTDGSVRPQPSEPIAAEGLRAEPVAVESRLHLARSMPANVRGVEVGRPPAEPSRAPVNLRGVEPSRPATNPRRVEPNRPSQAVGDRVLATPAARSLAREQGIDLASIPSDRGRITKADVLEVQARGSQTEPPPAPHSFAPKAVGVFGEVPPDEIVPFRGVRKRTAEAMTEAYRSAVHYTYVDEVNVTRLVAVRDQAKAAAAAEGVSLSYLPFIIKAVIRGLRKFPYVNATLDTAADQIRIYKRYDIGIATHTDNGLMVPVLRGADRKSLLEVAAEITDLSDRARSGSLSRDEMRGSTFTVTSLGSKGGLHATPILNPPEVGILGIHAIRKAALVDDADRIVVGRVMNLSVSLDHRVVDGFEGASFLQEIKRYLEDPTLLLLSGI